VEDHYWAFFMFMIPIIAIVGGITTAIVATVMRARVRELEIRERIAMIERGLVPPPEKDPQGFERAMSRYERARPSVINWPAGRTPARYRSAGITLIGVGLGLMLMIAFAGNEPSVGIGVGGFIAVIGVAFFVNSLLGDGQPPPPPSRDPGEPPRVS
jgi:hypothetical protein